MLSHVVDEVSFVEPFEIQQAFVNLSDEVSDLQVVENFLTAVERRYLNEPEPSFDRSRLRTSLQILEGFSGELHKEKFKRLVNEIREQLRIWISELQDRDDKIAAYHIRGFCDDTARRIEPIVYSALTRFYRTLGGSASSQSKFDLSVTRLFSKPTDPPYRQMLIEREDLCLQIEALFEGWDHSTPTRRSSAHASLVVAKLDDFQREGEGFTEYQDLVRSGIFERVREFKRKLGGLYFEPKITAAAVECNITIGNVFNSLLASANGNLGEGLNEGVDLAEAFYDASPGAEEHLTEILAELRVESEADTDTHNVTANELLELVCEGNPAPLRESLPASASLVDESEPEEKHVPKAKSAQKRLEPLFFTLSQPEPNHAVIREHLHRFAAIDHIDLSDFIGRPEDPVDHLCRNVLGVIFWIEELCEHELNQKGEMSASLKDELHRLLRKSEEFSEQLEYLVRENASVPQNRLLIVSNKLLESRLKLKRGIARFTRHNLAPEAEIVRKDEGKVAPVEPALTAPRSLFSTGRTSPWLVAATVLVSVISGIIFVLDQQMDILVPVAKDVDIIDVKRLPMGEHLQQAYRKDNIVFITAKSSWAQLAADDQQRNLKELVEFPSRTPVNTVMITDGMGRILGDITPEGTRILGNLQIADSAPVSDQPEAEPKAETSDGVPK